MGARRDISSGTRPRRSARIQGSEAPAVLGARGSIEDRGGVTKSKARSQPRTKQQKYDCTTCGRTLAASSFPKHLPSDSCTHLISTCRSCLKEWLAVQVENTKYDNISCPECPEIMHNSDIKFHAARSVYNRFDDLERRGIADKTPGWRWCLAPRCKAGQVHHAPTQTHPSIKGLGPLRRTERRVKKFDGFVSGPNICICHKCGAKACASCDRPWHEGETCEEYQKRLKAQNLQEEEAASQKTIQKQSKPCPTCKANIERNGGCDAMRCKCGEHFCFLCLRTYSVINQTGHEPTCLYSQPGRFDPHTMQGGMIAGGVVLGAGALIAGAVFMR